MMVDELIHVEVKKLYKDAQLPEFNYEDHIDDKLTMIYRSPRKLCFLSEGLQITLKRPYLSHKTVVCTKVLNAAKLK